MTQGHDSFSGEADDEEARFLSRGFGRDVTPPDYDAIDDHSDSDRRGTGAAKWMVLGTLFVATVGIAGFGGKWFGDLIGGPTGEIEEVAPPSPTGIPKSEPYEAKPLPIDPPAQLLPQLAVAISVAPEALRRPIEPESWVRQENLPRQMFGGNAVRGVIAAYLEVSRDGSVASCTIGSSSEVDPLRALQASGTSVCRALQANARFEPLADEPAIDPPAPLPDGEATPTSEPERDEVFVRVVFRTMHQPPAEEASE
ncbi:MAG: hypothetical protein WBA68_07735 [Alteraurantiacibacter sp.]